MRRVLLLVLAMALCVPPVRFAVVRLTEHEVDRATERWRAREEVVSRARVFVPAPPDIRSLDFKRTPNDRHLVDSDDVISCRYVPKPTSGTTSKFDCRLENGDLVKVKYGTSRERQGEIAATRLLGGLGFGADHVTFADRVRCHGCPPSPFKIRKVAEEFLASRLLDVMIDYDRAREFESVSVERKLEGRAIELDGFEGWDWIELKLVDATKGGASQADLDALRLMAVFLGHWDNKSTNQRLLCLGESETAAADSPCGHPLLMLQDLGATFGPTKVNYENWHAMPIWKDDRTCLVSMESMPYKGVLFPPTRISEAGRALLAARLTRLSEPQIRDLFTAARFPDPVTDVAPAADLTLWVRAFQGKVRQIADRTCAK